jgi:hypothetical protein
MEKINQTTNINGKNNKIANKNKQQKQERNKHKQIVYPIWSLFH